MIDLTYLKTALFVSIFVVAAMVSMATAAHAQWKPERRVEIVVGVGAGGPLDLTARLIQNIWQEHRILLPSALTTLAMRARAALAAQVLDTFEQYTILVGPTNTGGATPIPTETGIHSKEDAARRLLWHTCSGGTGTASMARNTFSLTGNPAISIPCGFNAKGLPLGFQLAARQLGEATLFQVCHAYQQATDWHRKHPPMPWAKQSAV